jgi:diguanylate cyclase (GGDEF)-like protein
MGSGEDSISRHWKGTESDFHIRFSSKIEGIMGHPRTKKRVCLLGAPLDGFYGIQFWKGAADEAEALGLDLVYLAGGFQRVYLDKFSEKCGLNESRSTLTYQFLDPSIFDGILVWGAQWQHDADDNLINSTLARFSPLPVVSVGWSSPQVYSILLDNCKGMREVVSHLIREHGHKKIAFIKSGHTFAQWEAEERFRGYCEELKANGIAVDPRLVVYGREVEEKRRESLNLHSFGEHWADLAMQELVDHRGLVPGRDFTALVARDDDAALTIISNLTARGVFVPKDVAVCGFDNNAAGRCGNPPLTTVAQSFSEQGMHGMRLLGSILDGETVSKVTYMDSPTPVIRESCGCPNQFMRRTYMELSGEGGIQRKISFVTGGIESVLEKITNQKASLTDLSYEIGAGMRRLEETGADPMEMAELLSALPISGRPAQGTAILQAAQSLVGDIAQRLQLLQFIKTQDRQDALDSINRDTFQTYNLDLVLDSVEAELPVIGARGCAIVLFSDPVNPLDKSRVIFASSRGQRSKEARFDAPEFSTRRILPDGLWPDTSEPISIYVEPLFFSEHRMGYVVMERGDSDGRSFPNLASRLASVLEGAVLVRSLNEKKTELEKAYANILELSERDSLTGLYNRRAFDREFLKEKRRMARYAQRDGLVCSLLFIDVDNFKYYNDAFGHDVGDAVLKVISEHITKIIRGTDTVSRYGGDEFVVLLPSTDIPGAEILAGRIISRLRDNPELLERIKELSGKVIVLPAGKGLSCSIGISSSILVGLEPEIILKTADHALYDAKHAGKGRYCISHSDTSEPAGPSRAE